MVAEIIDGATTAAIVIALVMMVLDVVTGIAKAVKDKSLNSTAMREGLWHKAGFVGLIVLSFVIEYFVAVVPVPAGVEIPDAPLTLLACVYIIAAEAISNFENICQLNPTVGGSYLGRLIESIEEGMEQASQTK